MTDDSEKARRHRAVLPGDQAPQQHRADGLGAVKDKRNGARVHAVNAQHVAGTRILAAVAANIAAQQMRIQDARRYAAQQIADYRAEKQ